MGDEYISVATRLLVALVAGGLVGLERTYHGRPAGLRTHMLVCTASTLLMLYTVFQSRLVPTLAPEIVRTDPTRMAQGIMTGIGFLGAGVVVKEQLSIRGLTTAASIWATAAIGIAIGVGFYFAAIMTLVLLLSVLSIFRWIESKAPTFNYARLTIRFSRRQPLSVEELNALISRHQMTSGIRSYKLIYVGEVFEYEMTVRTRYVNNFQRLAESLAKMENLQEFSIIPTRD